jgi:hypothetical protein
MAEETTTPPPLQFERGDDFESLYANNVQFELSSWDLKMIFGQLDQSGGRVTVKQHTAITIPWTQAKLGLYFLQANIAAYEIIHGKIKVPSDVLPPELPPPLPGTENEEPAKTVREMLLKLREQFLANL